MTEQGQEHKRRSPADWWLFVLGVVVFAAMGWIVTPIILYAEIPQPMSFNHQLHGPDGDAGKSCEECHPFREDGSFAGIPGLDNCKECHEEAMGETPDEKKLVEGHIAQDKPIPWKVYAKQPSCVYFSHAAHVTNAGMECQECHGDHGNTKVLRPYQENRLTGYSRDIWGWAMHGFADPPERMKMDDCANCHRENGVREACFVCHK